ncbi:hypothetical protein [Luedemannella helvata]|uniref:Zinc-finger domain-containing protein n=1 Tax=Luedemannella helvata TaxID=349315 RepID=A0ABN2L2X6_9ACTN
MSTDSAGWHVDRATLDGYATATLDMAQAASVEAHLLRCATCRDSIAEGAAPSLAPRLDQVWAGIVDRVDAPRLSVVERLLRLLGVPAAEARIVAATSSLRLPWLGATAAALAFAVVAARADANGMLFFLSLAPITPVLSVAVAFGARTDPTYEIGLAAPYSAFRVLLLRAAAVIVSTSVLALAAGSLTPSRGLSVAVWLLPALGLTLLTLALSGWFDSVTSAAVVAAGWLVVVVTTVEGDRLTALGPIGQLCFLVLALGSAAVLVRRRDRLGRI